LQLFLAPMATLGLSLLPAGQVTAQTFTTVHNFTALSGSLYTNSDGARPKGALIVSGNTLYGTTEVGSVGARGEVFALNTDGTGFTTLHSFDLSGGGSPVAGLILDGNTLYGTTEFGGGSNKGSVFRLSADGTGFTNLHAFTPGDFNGSPGFFTNRDGAAPWSTVVLSGNTLYGTTYVGSTNSSGTVFAVNTDGTGFTTLHRFGPIPLSGVPTNSGGARPTSALTLSGNTLYGTTFLGGIYGAGTVFAINMDGTGFRVVHTFTKGSDGTSPFGGLVLSGSTLYGTASSGGAYGWGTVFAVNTDGSGFATLHSFTSIPGPYGGNYGGVNTDGAQPYGGLILSGNTLYGTAYLGGASGYGVVFGVNTDGTGFTNLYNFQALPPISGGGDPPPVNSGGANPYSGLLLSGNTLFGTAYNGGASGYGTLFSISLPTPPRPGIVVSAGNIVLSWPTNIAGLTLQSATNLGPSAVWTSNSTPPVIVNGQNVVTNPASGPLMFYRLRQ
jgi:uncharacterized repeat protein (TIGR03803 family)